MVLISRRIGYMNAELASSGQFFVVFWGINVNGQLRVIVDVDVEFYSRSFFEVSAKRHRSV